MTKKQKASSSTEKRKHPRINISNEVNYILLGKNENKYEKGKGKALNLSQSGVLLETQTPLNGSFIILMTIDLEGNEVQVQGQVVHTGEADKAGRYLSGITFSKSGEKHIKAIVAFVKTYYRRQYANK